MIKITRKIIKGSKTRPKIINIKNNIVNAPIIRINQKIMKIRGPPNMKYIKSTPKTPTTPSVLKASIDELITSIRKIMIVRQPVMSSIFSCQSAILYLNSNKIFNSNLEIFRGFYDPFNIIA